MDSAQSTLFIFKLLRNKLILGMIFFLSIIFLCSTHQVQKSFAYESQNDYSNASSSVKRGEESSSSFNTNPDVPLTLRSFVQVLMIESLSAVSCQLAGYDPTRPNDKCLGVNPNTGKIGFTENGGGLITVVGSLIDATFVPPASSSQYLSYLHNNFGLVKSTYASNHNPNLNPCYNNTRGVGFCSILPILNIWVTMRNIAYLILILVFIVIGVGIMLRIHIDPRTVMTVQNQIPKIIAGIIVISFSFAIAGFMIDIMWFTTYLFASVLGSATSLDSATMIKIIRAANPIDAANAIHGSGDGGVINIASSASRALGYLAESAFTNQQSSMGVLKDIIRPLVSIIAFLIFIIAIVVALLRLWLSLVITYVNIILDIVFAPFWILAGALPGSSLGIGGWFKDMLANLAVFPVAISFFILANYFVGAFDASTNNIVQNNMAPPLLGGTDSSAVAAVIGLGFILMLPNLLTTTKGFFKAPKVNFGPIMGPVGVGAGFVGGIPKRVSSGVLNEATRMRYVNGHPTEPTGIRKWVRIVRGGSH